SGVIRPAPCPSGAKGGHQCGAAPRYMMSPARAGACLHLPRMSATVTSMRLAGGLVLLAALSAAAEEATPKDGPVLRGSSADATAAANQDLLVFKGSTLFNEFVYRAVINLPPDSAANPPTARLVATEIAAFLREAGYELAKVRAQVKGDQIEVLIDEGALDKIIFVGAGWITALRFRATLNLPLDVFNRRLFESQMPKLQ